MPQQDYLIVSEEFYSIQGEGFSAGYPAVFIRLAGCNLRCHGFSYVEQKTQQHLGCDTAHVWQTGIKKTCEEIINEWQHNNWLYALNEGAHLVITGGEPLIQQTVLIEFIKLLDRTLKQPCYIEIETNATILFVPEFLQRINQINASPKLSNNGDPREKTYISEVIEQLANCDKTKFKFVISQRSDINEIINNYVFPFKIKQKNVWLMPEGGTRKAIYEKAPWVVDLCKRHMFNYSPRLQVNIWEEVTGV